MAGTRIQTESYFTLVCESELISGSSILNSIEGIDVESLVDGTTCYARDSTLTFRWFEDSMAAPTPGSVILPVQLTAGEPGRWLQITGGGGGGGAVDSVSGTAGIAAAPATGNVVVSGAALYARDGSNGPMTAVVNFGGFAGQSLANPTNPQDAATKAYVDAAVTSVGTPALVSVLTVSNNGGALQIKNIANPTVAQDAATKAYVDAAVAGVGTPTLANVLLVGNSAGAKIINLTNPTLAQDAATKFYVDAGDAATLVSANAYTDAAVAAVPVSPLASVLVAGNSAGAKIINLTDPTAAQDAATKNYVDTRPAPPADTLTAVLTAGNNAGALQIVNLANPLLAQDAATKFYVDAGDAATLASANAHADAGDVTTLASANAYADAGDVATLASANAYTDAAVAAVPVPPLASVLVSGNSAGAKIVNLTDPTAAQDAATKNYVDTRPAPPADTLTAVLTAGNSAGTLQITDLANPTLPQDAATKAYVDASAGGGQNLGGVLIVGNDGGALQIKNIADPTVAQDAATKNYVDTRPAPPADTLTAVLTAGNDGGALQIKNIADPTLAQDAVTKFYVDTALFGVTPAPTVLYVNGTTGNDANAGTVGAPLATVTEALRRVGPVVRTNCSITITAPGVYDGTALGTSRSYLAYLDVATDESTEIVAATGTVGSSGFQLITAAGAPGWVVDQWLGHWVRMTSGAQAGELRGILANTADTITPLDGYAADVVAGDTFEIVRPGVSIATRSIVGDDDSNLALFYVHLQYTSRLSIQGTFFAMGISFPTGSSITSNQIYCASGGINSDSVIGVAWLKVGAFPIGTLKLLGSNGMYLFGHLGYVEPSNVGGYGHSGGYHLGGRYGLDATGSDVSIGNPFVSYQATLAVTYLDDYGVLDRPCWMLMSRGEMYRVSVVGSGPLAGRIMLRDKSFLEQTRGFETPSMPDVAGGSTWRIGYAGNGNFSNVLVDDINNNAGPGITFNTTGEVLTGNLGADIYRTN